MTSSKFCVDAAWDCLRSCCGLSTLEIANHSGLSVREAAAALAQLRRNGRASFWRGSDFWGGGVKGHTALFWHAVRVCK